MKLTMKQRLFALLLILSIMAGCGKNNQPGGGRAVGIYFLNNAETGVLMQEYELQARDTMEQL